MLAAAGPRAYPALPDNIFIQILYHQVAMKKTIPAVLAVLCLLMLLSQPGLAYAGACRGLLLWAQVVLPTLLPFMICSGAIAALGGIPILTRPFKPILSGFLGLSQQGSFVFITGLLIRYSESVHVLSQSLSLSRLRSSILRYH